MAAGLFSRLEPFDCRNGDFDYYLEQFDHFLMLNSIEEENKRVPLFITSIGQDAYKILKEICEPIDPKEKSFEQLKSSLQEYFARRAFYARNQRPGEYPGAYVNELKRLQLKCDFGAFAKEALRDRIACGKLADDNKSEKKQAAAPILPDELVKQLTIAAEPKPKQKKQQPPAPVTAVAVAPPEEGKKQKGGKSGQKQQHKCRICGHTHQESECAHKDASCFLCRKKGHIASVCREKKNNQPGQQPVQVHVHVAQNTAMKNDSR